MTDQTNLNIDPQEISKFEELASRWWDKESEFKPLHDINPLRVGFIDRHADLAGREVLDVAVAAAFYRKRWRIVALSERYRYG